MSMRGLRRVFKGVPFLIGFDGGLGDAEPTVIPLTPPSGHRPIVHGVMLTTGSNNFTVLRWNDGAGDERPFFIASGIGGTQALGGLESANPKRADGTFFDLEVFGEGLAADASCSVYGEYQIRPDPDLITFSDGVLVQNGGTFLTLGQLAAGERAVITVVLLEKEKQAVEAQILVADTATPSPGEGIPIAEVVDTELSLNLDAAIFVEGPKFLVLRGTGNNRFAIGLLQAQILRS